MSLLTHPKTVYGAWDKAWKRLTKTTPEHSNNNNTAVRNESVEQKLRSQCEENGVQLACISICYSLLIFVSRFFLLWLYEVRFADSAIFGKDNHLGSQMVHPTLATERGWFCFPFAFNFWNGFKKEDIRFVAKEIGL